MKVLPKNFYDFNSGQFRDRKSISFLSRGGLHSIDKFVLSEQLLVSQALSKLKKINIEGYKSLSEVEKKFLRDQLPKIALGTNVSANYQEEVERHHFAAESVRQYFDKLYGEGKYEIIVIGRSLASIGKLLSFKIGEENVKNIPMSSLKRFSIKEHNWINWLKNKNYRDENLNNEDIEVYLKELKLDRKSIENTGKHYILLDYTVTGDSLDVAYDILTSPSLMGNKNVVKVSIVDILARYVNKYCIGLGQELYHEKYKKYAQIGRLSEFNRENLTQALVLDNKDEKTLNTLKLFGFALLDSELYEKKGDSYKGLEFKEVPAVNILKTYPWLNLSKRILTEIHDDYVLLCRALENINDDKILNKSEYYFSGIESYISKAKKGIDISYEYTNCFLPKLENFIAELNSYKKD